MSISRVNFARQLLSVHVPGQNTNQGNLQHSQISCSVFQNSKVLFLVCRGLPSCCDLTWQKERGWEGKEKEREREKERKIERGES